MFRRNFAAALAAGAAAVLIAGAMPASAGSIRSDAEEFNIPTAFTPARLGLDSSAKFVAILGSNASKSAAIDAAKALGATINQQYSGAVNGFAFTATNRAASALAKNPVFDSISATQLYTPDNTASDAHTGATTAWQNYGFTGKGVKVAIIDSGIDYCHTDFGGTGSPCYTANPDNTVIEPGSFPTAKVIAGTDLVGDAYNAGGDAAAKVPHPDPDPQDCNDHGSHVAGTAAGIGVNADGSTYKGAYTADAITNLKIGPGSAPEASLMAFRVFGCSGSVDSSVVIDAINRAVAAGANVINMSLGSSFGVADGGYNAAITAAVKAGVVVVASAGNSGPGAYITGSPGSTKAALSVAAINNDTIPGTVATFTDGSTVGLQNGGTLPSLASGTFATTPDFATNATKRLGCNATDFNDADGNSVVTGKIAVVQRGTCTFAAKQAAAYAAGASMLVIVQNSSNGAAFIGGMASLLNTIPVFSAQYYLAVGGANQIAAWAARSGQSATFADGLIANASANAPASFTSGGPRSGDGGFKPDVAAPGVSIRSVLSGSGNGFADFSGTSMASPHTAGAVALIRQAHPTWNAFQVKASIVNTATKDTSKVTGSTRLIGNGLIQPATASQNSLLVYPAAITKDGDTSLSFGVLESKSVTATRPFVVENQSGSSKTITLSGSIEGAPAGASLTFSKSSFTLAAGAKATVNATLTLSSAYMAARSNASQSNSSVPGVANALFAQVSATDGTNVSTIPVSAIPYGRAALSSRMSGSTLTVTNNGNHYGSAEVYDWMLAGKKDATGTVGVNIRSVGVETWTSGSTRYLQFALDTFNPVYNWASVYTEIGLDTTGDGNPDYAVYTADYGYYGGSGVFNGQTATFVYNFATKTGAVKSYTPAAVNSSLIAPYVSTSALGMSNTAGNDKVSIVYAYASPWIGADDEVDATASTFGTFKPWAPLRSNSNWLDIAGGASATTTLTSTTPAAGERKSLGWLVVTPDAVIGSQASQIRAF